APLNCDIYSHFKSFISTTKPKDLLVKLTEAIFNMMINYKRFMNSNTENNQNNVATWANTISLGQNNKASNNTSSNTDLKALDVVATVSQKPQAIKELKAVSTRKKKVKNNLPQMLAL
ncbi:9295_t:CDS:2, partial [Dentiscutata heterogama]